MSWKLLRSAAICSLIAATCSIGAEPLRACSFIAIQPLNLTEAERKVWEKEQRQQAAKEERGRMRDFQRNVRTGKIDSASGLARLLIPNIRQEIGLGECATDKDNDGPVMPHREMLAAAVSHPEFKAFEPEDIPGRLLRHYQNEFVPACNVEFREKFAADLRKTVLLKDRKNAYLALSESGARMSWTYYRFTEPYRATRPSLAGNRYRGTLPINVDHPVLLAWDEFWRNNAEKLNDPSDICPASFESFQSVEVELAQKAR